MVLFENTWLLIFAATVISLHIVPRIFHGVLTNILEIVNIGLHIALICAMLWNGIPFEEATLVVMASLLVYTLCYFLFAKFIRERRAEK